MELALHSNSSDDRDEGVLSEVLDELDRERLRRAELESEVRKLQEENNTLRSKQQHAQESTSKSGTNDTNAISQRVFVAMETQVQGYQQLVDALTLGKPAIAAAAAEDEALLAKKKMFSTTTTTTAMTPLHHRFGLPTTGGNDGTTGNESSSATKRKTLPLHIVRLLEVLPWDIKTRQHIFAVEEIYEWQTFHENVWQSQLQYFPSFFKSLPHIKAEAASAASSLSNLTNPNSFGGDDYDETNHQHNNNNNQHHHNRKDSRNFLQFLAGADLQRKQNKSRIFTDARISVVYDLDAGYPLPSNDGGVWEWVGSWRISSRTSATGSITEAMDNHERVDSDQQGWSYVIEPRDFLVGLKDMIWDNAGGSEPTAPTRLFRRRRWARQRVLVDYASASESTRQYLKILAENARLSLSAAKISEQLIETKLLLTETEEKLAHANDLLHQNEKSVKTQSDEQQLISTSMLSPSEKETVANNLQLEPEINL